MVTHLCRYCAQWLSVLLLFSYHCCCYCSSLSFSRAVSLNQMSDNKYQLSSGICDRWPYDVSLLFKKYDCPFEFYDQLELAEPTNSRAETYAGAELPWTRGNSPLNFLKKSIIIYRYVFILIILFYKIIFYFHLIILLILFKVMLYSQTFL